MAANLSLPMLPFSPSKTHRSELFTPSPASSRTNVSRPSRVPRVLMALSPLEKHNLPSFSFFPNDLLIKTKPPQNPSSSSSSPTPSDLNFGTDDNTASDLKTGDPASDLPSSIDVDSPALHNRSSPSSSDFNLGSDMGDSINLKPVNPGSDLPQSEMRTPQLPQPPSV